jgi:hypothetical protein
MECSDKTYEYCTDRNCENCPVKINRIAAQAVSPLDDMVVLQTDSSVEELKAEITRLQARLNLWEESPFGELARQLYRSKS